MVATGEYLCTRINDPDELDFMEEKLKNSDWNSHWEFKWGLISFKQTLVA